MCVDKKQTSFALLTAELSHASAQGRCDYYRKTVTGELWARGFSGAHGAHLFTFSHTLWTSKAQAIETTSRTEPLNDDLWF